MSTLVKTGEPSSHSGPSDRESIPLYVVNGIATVWDAQTAATLHCVHDISGLRAGTLPGVVQQNGFLGLPITLMPEETAFLVNNGIAHLVPLPQTLAAPTPDQIAARTAARVTKSRAVAERMRRDDQRRQEEAKRKFAAAGEAALQKRRERAIKKAEKEKARAEAAGESVSPEVEAVLRGDFGELAGQGEVDKRGESSKEGSAAEALPTPTADNSNIFTVVPALPVLDSLVPTASPVAPTLPPSLPYLPRTPRNKALAQTFAALHARGYRMGLGPRFGGEYLIYPGDYLRYHAHFTSQVVVRNDPIRPAEIVAWGRLGTGTKKAGLICCWDDGEDGEGEVEGEPEKEGKVEFYSLEWANFG